MKENKNIPVIVALTVFFTLVVAAGGYFAYNHFWGNQSGADNKKDVYTCPMHPQIVSDHPGACPICGMDLVLKSKLDAEEKGNETDGHNPGDIQQVKLSPSEQVLANVQTEKVKTMQFSGEKTFNGYVKINEKNFAHISTAVSGKIVNMFVNFEGQQVTKGQPVMELYSPELVSTQKEYLLAMNNFEQVKKSGNTLAIEQAESLVDASKQRLLLLEMTPRQVEELQRTQQVRTTVVQYSKYSGVITKKYVHVGHWAMAGEDIFDIADLSTIWVIANVYESDVQFIKAGQTAQIISSAFPDEIMTAKINYINPVFNQDSRTMEVRIDVSNRNLKLKPDMYVKVKLNTFAGQNVAVRKNAVIRTGERNIVYVEREKGIYEPREVIIGYEQDGYYSVTSGLKDGEVVVTAGGFLIDSETQIEQGLHQSKSSSKDMKPKDDDVKINPDQDIMKDMKHK